MNRTHKLVGILQPLLFSSVAVLVASKYSNLQVSCQDSQSNLQRPSFEACPEVACASAEDVNAFFGSRIYSRPRNVSKMFTDDRTQNSAPSASSEKDISSSSEGDDAAVVQLECPPMREELGYHTWNLLHSTAAYYPNNPSEADKLAASGLISAIAQLYPCTHCRSRFQEDIRLDPPQLSSREEFALWVCKQHNVVNELLGKQTFPCNMEKLDERWRVGRKECWGSGPLSQNAEESLGQSSEEDD